MNRLIFLIHYTVLFLCKGSDPVVNQPVRLGIHPSYLVMTRKLP